MTAPLAYSSTFILGALHALEPGHGKTFIASYVTGEKIDIKHLATLGISLMLSHFLMLTILAVVLKFIFLQIDSVAVHRAFNWVGPFLIILFGAYLLLRYFFHKKKYNEIGHSCKHDHHFKLEKPALTQTALVGTISGFLPCPTAIAPLMLSGIENNFSNALFYILIYVVGMSLVILAFTGIFYYAKDSVVKRIDAISGKLHPHVVGALLIIIVGVVYLFLGIRH